MSLRKDFVAAIFTLTLISSVLANQCDPQLQCQNDGSLDQSVCKCYCAQGFHGRKCEVATATACEWSGCEERGMACVPCSVSMFGIRCTCKTGRCGFRCERDDGDMMRQCNPNPCMNGGYCSARMDWKNNAPYCKQKCECLPGFGGRQCQIVDPCRRNRCTQPTLYECREDSQHYLGRQCIIRNQWGSPQWVQDDVIEED